LKQHLNNIVNLLIDLNIWLFYWFFIECSLMDVKDVVEGCNEGNQDWEWPMWNCAVMYFVGISDFFVKYC